MFNKKIFKDTAPTSQVHNAEPEIPDESKFNKWIPEFIQSVANHDILLVSESNLNFNSENKLLETLDVMVQELLRSKKFNKVIVINPILLQYTSYTSFTPKKIDNFCYDYSYNQPSSTYDNPVDTIFIEGAIGQLYNDSLLNILRMAANTNNDTATLIDCRDFLTIAKSLSPHENGYELISNTEKQLIQFVRQIARREIVNLFQKDPKRKHIVVLTTTKNYIYSSAFYSHKLPEFSRTAYDDPALEKLVELLNCSSENKEQLLKPRSRYLLMQQYPQRFPDLQIMERKYEFSSVEDIVRMLDYWS